MTPIELPLPKRASASEVAATKAEIEKIIDTLEVSQGGDKDKAFAFSTSNIKSWKARFYKTLKEKFGQERKFTFKQSSTDREVFFVWRLK